LSAIKASLKSFEDDSLFAKKTMPEVYLSNL